MTTVSRVNTVSHSNVSSGGGDWDHRLNRLLEDLQDSVIPPESKGKTSEYREYRMTSSSKVNDEPAQTVDEKWVEYGTKNGGGFTDSAYHSSGGTSRFGQEKSVGFADQQSSSSSYRSNHFSSNRDEFTSSRNTGGGQIEYLSPSNTTTVLKSGPTSPSGYSVTSSTGQASPRVEKKEYYSKASYTTLIKGTGEPGQMTDFDDRDAERILHEMIPSDFPSPSSSKPPGLPSTSTTSESRRTFMSESRSGTSNAQQSIGYPMYTSTPMKTTSFERDIITDRSVTPPPKQAEGLKTPPLVRKILQSSSSSSSAYNKSMTSSSGRPPTSPATRGIPSYDEPPEPRPARYYTSTTTTEHREQREMSPVRRFPSPQPPRNDGYGAPPKNLHELMSTFEDSSYRHESNRHIGGDGGGPHKSTPYGPGTHQVRTVRIDDNVQQRQFDDDDTELVQRKTTNYQNPAYGDNNKVEPTRNVSGPPVFYPSNQIFTKTAEESLMQAQEAEKGKGKAKMERKYKEKEKMKSKHSEKDGGGAVPVPVCLPVCCAAPCVIM